MLVSGSVWGQFRQDRSDVEYMFKWEAGYAPFVSNLGQPNYDGLYNINEPDLRHAAGLNLINGVCLYQDFFLGLGLGYDYLAVPAKPTEGWHSALAFIDFDYRPLDMDWSPMAYARAGAHYMLRPDPLTNTLTPYLEVGLGANWYYNYYLSNYERNYRSLFFTIGVAYMQQSVFMPIRIGMRF